jgi:uncharacterized UBP type Zn finger protein
MLGPGRPSISGIERIRSFDSTERSVACDVFLAVVPRDKPMTCSHMDRIHAVQPSGSGCHECLLARDTWLHLRMCTDCGHVGCCDSSKNKHAIRHFRSTGHPIARSIQPGEEWGWCYIDQLWFEKLPRGGA